MLHSLVDGVATQQGGQHHDFIFTGGGFLQFVPLSPAVGNADVAQGSTALAPSQVTLGTTTELQLKVRDVETLHFVH